VVFNDKFEWARPNDYQNYSDRHNLETQMTSNHKEKYLKNGMKFYKDYFYVNTKTISSNHIRIPKNSDVQVLSYNIANDCMLIKIKSISASIEIKRSEEVEIINGNKLTRSFFPLISSFARTAHLVQSTTVSNEVKFGVVNTCINNDDSIMYTILSRAEETNQIQLLFPMKMTDFSTNIVALKFDKLYFKQNSPSVVPLDKTIGMDGKEILINRNNLNN
jgi:hypothetical protein